MAADLPVSPRSQTKTYRTAHRPSDGKAITEEKCKKKPLEIVFEYICLRFLNVRLDASLCRRCVRPDIPTGQRHKQTLCF